MHAVAQRHVLKIIKNGIPVVRLLGLATTTAPITYTDDARKYLITGKRQEKEIESVSTRRHDRLDIFMDLAPPRPSNG